jgi:predicted SAM-dependent methyltransferase
MAKKLPEPVKVLLRSIRRSINITKGKFVAPGQFRSLKGRKNLKLNLGCGSLVKSSWVNIDMYIPDYVKTVLTTHPDTVLINHNVCKSLPLDNGSCDYIYASHFFEHLESKEGIKLMRQCFAKLKSGGVFRIALPNFRMVFEAYLTGNCALWDLVDQQVDAMMPGIAKTALDYLNFAVYQSGEHKCIYDEERLKLILQKIGFRSAGLSAYQEGIDESVATHRRYSFYVEAIK